MTHRNERANCFCVYKRDLGKGYLDFTEFETYCFLRILFGVSYSAGPVKPLVQGLVHRQTPVHLPDNVARVPGTGSQLSAKSRPYGIVLLQNETEVKVEFSRNVINISWYMSNSRVHSSPVKTVVYRRARFK